MLLCKFRMFLQHLVASRAIRFYLSAYVAEGLSLRLNTGHEGTQGSGCTRTSSLIPYLVPEWR